MERLSSRRGRTQIGVRRRGSVFAAVFFVFSTLAGAQYTAPYVSLVGVVSGASGMPARNYILTLAPTQVMFVGGSSVVVANATCATDANGQLVGMWNPLTAPVTAATYATGTAPAANYYIKITWYDQFGRQTLPSVEAVQQLTSTGSLVISPPAYGAPANAVGMNVYIGTSAGGETYQGQTTSTTATFTQSAPITTNGAVPPVQNNSVCIAVANDAAWPIAGYNATLISPSGNTVPGFPQQWQLTGPGSSYNVSNGFPLYNGRVTYPVPVLTTPYNHNAQSISGPLSLTGYNLYNVARVGVGTALPAYGVDVENGTGILGAINASQGYLVNGAGGASGQCLGSDGSYYDVPIACITSGALPTLYYQQVAINGSTSPQEPLANYSSYFNATDSSGRTNIGLNLVGLATKIATSDTQGASGDCVKWGADGGMADAGQACFAPSGTFALKMWPGQTLCTPATSTDATCTGTYTYPGSFAFADTGYGLSLTALSSTGAGVYAVATAKTTTSFSYAVWCTFGCSSYGTLSFDISAWHP